MGLGCSFQFGDRVKWLCRIGFRDAGAESHRTGRSQTEKQPQTLNRDSLALGEIEGLRVQAFQIKGLRASRRRHIIYMVSLNGTASLLMPKETKSR